MKAVGVDPPRLSFRGLSNARASDPNVKFEEYLYFARISRAREDQVEPSGDTFASNPWDFRRRRSSVADTGGAALEGESLDESLHGDEKEKTARDRVRDHADADVDDKQPAVEAHAHSALSPVEHEHQHQHQHHGISHAEWLRLSRATRNTSWSVVFFLITTDMFGPLSIP